MRRWTLWLGLVTLLLGGGGCASSASRFDSEAGYRVTRIDFRSGQQFTLINRSHPATRADRGGMGSGVKVIEDDRMVELLDFFDDWDYFELAIVTPETGPLVDDNALKAIVVGIDDRTQSLVHELPTASRPIDDDLLEAIQAIDTEFRYVFNTTHQLFYTDNPEGAQMFDAYKRRSSAGRSR